MKINEKNLIVFAAASTPVDKEGWLSKRGEVNRSYSRRWFVLKGNLLFYFEKNTDKEPVGLIVLEGCSIELCEEEESFCFQVAFHGAGDRTYILSADSQESMESWMKALACASIDYIQLRVADLQRQVDELTEVEKMQQLQSLSLLQEDNQAAVASVISIPPPRPRINPFNVEAKSSVLTRHAAGVAHSANGSATITSATRMKVFTEFHEKYGSSIKRLRTAWLQNQAQDLITL